MRKEEGKANKQKNEKDIRQEINEGKEKNK